MLKAYILHKNSLMYTTLLFSQKKVRKNHLLGVPLHTVGTICGSLPPFYLLSTTNSILFIKYH